MNEITKNIRIVMVETTHPGNIGAAARAMKTMGHKNLYLVKPKIFPSAEVTARAAGADDILATAVVCNSLDEALQDCLLVVATSARDRSIPWPVYKPDDCARQIIATAQTGQVAIIFGRESSGLTNVEIERCNAMIKIPTNPDFNSLNIASAIQLICYEITNSIINLNNDTSNKASDINLASSGQLIQFYDHLEQCMIDLNFYNPGKPRRLMRRLKRLFNRARLDDNEINILRGLLAAAQSAVNKNKGD